MSAEEEYERQFFYLRVFVLGSIGCVFSTLVLMFWIYFMYLWRTWDSGSKREQMAACPETGFEIPGGEIFWEIFLYGNIYRNAYATKYDMVCLRAGSAFEYRIRMYNFLACG